ncbi:MAG: DUF4126 domain-containing protein [Anaerolineales bacterium]|nr:DUF4126 domain-containing protein [Anaerolineales bacterium]MCB9126885.1 DUF4126 domain-containing protein [Ardenticatenales bacterium]
MESILALFTAFGLSSSAGLNAYIPLLITGLVARYTDLLTLNGPFATLENPWVLGTLAVLLLIEMTVDKIPALDSLNDVIHTVIRPAAGAILFAANSGAVGGMDPAFAMVLGLLTAGSVHATKAVARPVVTASTAGLGNSVVSAGEDVVATVASLLAIFVPLLMGLVLLVAFFTIGRWWFGRRNRALPSNPIG